MTVRVTIHQPTYFAWMGYFHKISLSDIHVILDDVDFSYGGWINRVQIFNPQKEELRDWLTVPAKKSQGVPINKSSIAYNQRWVDKHLRTLEYRYSKCPYYQETMDLIEKLLTKEYKTIADLNIAITKRFCKELGIETQFIQSSSLDIHETDRTGKLIEILQKVKGTTYIYGGGCDYMDLNQFESAGITLEGQNFVHPDYTHTNGECVKGLSIVDALFHIGIHATKKTNY